MKQLSIALMLISATLVAQEKTKFVNTMIGTGGHGHTFPGAVVPFGMVQLSPDTRIDGSWDGCSGYHYSDSRIYGFSHTHLSGTGCSDWGDVMVMPYIGEQSVSPEIYSSKFDHSTEKTTPGYYSVELADDKVRAELTVTPRVGIHKYNFGKTANANVVLDLLHRDKVTGCGIFLVDSVTVVGFRNSEAWAKNQKIFFAIKFSKPFVQRQLANNGKFIERLGKFKIQTEQGVFSFDLSDGSALMIKVALSGVSIDGAIANMNAEAAHWDFEQYKTEALKTWEKQLSKIDVSESDPDKKTVFYTALYHACIHPSLNMDVDGQYRGRDDKVHKAIGFTNYSVFSLWDTYRALHPLMTIIEQKRTNDFIQSFITQFQQGGRLPVWELSSNETDCMIGFHSVSVIADAMAKEITNFDLETAYAAAKASTSYTGFGLPEFNKYGFLSVDNEHESVSKTLEYSYDFWCVAQMATRLNKYEEADYYTRRAFGYRQMFDSTSGFMRPRKNGNWLSPFYANEINNHFTEGNSWHYSFSVPHDINGLIGLHGGAGKFEAKLDELFTASSATRGREQADVTGLIGQYAHGNEPSHHLAFLYNYVNKPEKTAERINQICSQFYKNSNDGLIGNEDCGQMSAWYVLASLGIYQVCPGDPRYTLVPPQFAKSTIHLENNKTITITADKKTGEKWIGSAFDGKPLLRLEIPHMLIANGGELRFVFGDKNSTSNFAPCGSILSGNIPLAAPIIVSGAQVFKSAHTISLVPFQRTTGKIIYTLDGSVPGPKALTYQSPITIDSNTTVKARICNGTDTSVTTEAVFYKVKNNFELKLLSTCNPQYQADGAQSLIDGLPLSTNWRKGNWLGVQEQNFEIEIDRTSNASFKNVKLTCLQDARSWILYPQGLQLWGSKDGKKYVKIAEVRNNVNALDFEPGIKDITVELQNPVSYRFLKVVAENAGKLPSEHIGAGGASFIFAGELTID